MNTSEVLNRAADLIEKRGWGGDWYATENEPVCVEGALLAAIGMKPDDRWALDEGDRPVFYSCPAYLAVTEYLGDVLFPRVDPLWVWNDDSDRTQAEVIEVLRAAAVIEQAKEAAPVEVGAR